MSVPSSESPMPASPTPESDRTGSPPPPPGPDDKGPSRTIRRGAVWLVGAFILAIVTAAGSQFYGLLVGQLPLPTEHSSASATAVQPSTPIAMASTVAPSPTAPPATPTSTPPQATEVRLIAPFLIGGDLRPFYRVATDDTSGQGDCDFSHVSSDPEALRCFAGPDGSDILDPCWRDLEDTQVACLADPWTVDVTLVHNPVLPDRAVGEGRLLPWALELAVPGSGPEQVRCTFVSGFGHWIAGQRVLWDCRRGGEDAGGVVGEPDKPATGPWLVQYSAPDTAEVVKVPVRTVWR